MTVSAREEIARVVVCGHVDHGKSTVMARILMELGCIPEDRIAKVEKVCSEKNSVFEPAFLLDALKEEQEQGVTIDTTRHRLEHQGRQLLLIDAPGHLEFLKNMTSGASDAELGVVVVDCTSGVEKQTRIHMEVLSILGIRNVVVAVNKMDLVAFAQDKFDEIALALNKLAEDIGVTCRAIVPVAALSGDNVVSLSERMPWYAGRGLLDVVFELGTQASKLLRDVAPADQPVRMLLQDVYKFDDTRYFAGSITSGLLKTGSTICFSPSGKLSTIKAIAKHPRADVREASPGESVGLVLDQQIFVERGEIVSLAEDAPEVDSELYARVVWLSSDKFTQGANYTVKLGSKSVEATVTFVNAQGEAADQATIAGISIGSFADAVIACKSPVAFDRNKGIGLVNRFVIASDSGTVAAGSIHTHARVRKLTSQRTGATDISPEALPVQRHDYEKQAGHGGTVLWMTGLSAAGKSTLAKAVGHHFFQQGFRTIVLDADNFRSGLSSDLGFTPEERSENIRRLAHVSRLFLDTGFIVVVACISPYEADRTMASEIIGAADFHEIFVFCPLEECQRRDPKGLYKKADSGKIQSMTGTQSPYQSPKKPALRLDTSQMSVADEVARVERFLVERGVVEAALVPATDKAGLSLSRK